MPVDEVSVPTPVNSSTPVQFHGGCQGVICPLDAQIESEEYRVDKRRHVPLLGLLQLLLHNHLYAFLSTVAPLSFVDLPSQELAISGRGYPWGLKSVKVDKRLVIYGVGGYPHPTRRRRVCLPNPSSYAGNLPNAFRRGRYPFAFKGSYVSLPLFPSWTT